jgi:small subunit ribosomal protein S1
MDEFDRLLQENFSKSISVGSVIEGRVVSITEDAVLVDIGYKSEGILPFAEILDDDIPNINLGDVISVKVVRKVEGDYYLSKKTVDFARGWASIKEDTERGSRTKIRIVEKVKGGYQILAYNAIRGFINEKNFPDGPPQIGQLVEANVSEYDRKTKRLYFTRRQIIAEEREKKLEEELSRFAVGDVVEGTVDRLSGYGAFVELAPGLTGLLHNTEIAHDAPRNPNQVLKIGQRVRVKIISLSREDKKISLSMKALTPDPIHDVLPEEVFEGVVDSVTDFGIFVRLPIGVVGLVHVSELSHKNFGHPRELFRTKDKVRVKVLGVNVPERRVSLSIKALEMDPWKEVFAHFNVGERVDVTVTRIIGAGLIVKLDDFYEGFIPTSEICKERIAHPKDKHDVGDAVKAQIISIEPDKKRIKLSIRRTLSDDEEGPREESFSPKDAAPTAAKYTLADVFGKSKRAAEPTAPTPEAPPPSEAKTNVESPASPPASETPEPSLEDIKEVASEIAAIENDISSEHPETEAAAEPPEEAPLVNEAEKDEGDEESSPAEEDRPSSQDGPAEE